MEPISLIGTIIGGLGLFLLAVGMMTDGLKLAAGKSLRTLLSESSKTPLRGIFTGFFMTAIVQSSSAVTVASLGFVNAGLISMRQALGIVYGANVGTTMTGWLVALIGFKLNVQAFALPLIGAGMLMKLIKQQGKLASFGLALVGFGLFFIGIDVLKGAFEGIVQAFDINKLTADGLTGIATFLSVGIVMTILTQSSSASIALTIAAVASGVVGVYAAGAMVIGANIGTTSTAILAAIGATSNAKRVAVAQVIFNVGTALVALCVMPILFYLISVTTGLFNTIADPAISLALFHTVFNVLGVVLIYPFNDRISAFLEARFHAQEDEPSRPQYLDRTIAQTPVLAVNALLLENLALSEKVLQLYSQSIRAKAPNAREFSRQAHNVKLLSAEVSKFIVGIGSSALSEDTNQDLATLMRIEQYFLGCVQSIQRFENQFTNREVFSELNLEQSMIQFLERVLTFMRVTLAKAENLDGLNVQFEELHLDHDRKKAKLILEGTRARISVVQMTESIDCLAEAIRLAQQWNKALIRIKTLQAKLENQNDPELMVVSED